MELNLEDPQTYKLVTFYSGVTCVYFPILISGLYFTNYLYSIGKYSFYPVIGLIAVAECIKYFFGTYHVIKKHGTGGRLDDRYPSSHKRVGTKYKLKEILKCAVLISVMQALYFLIAILFGAPVLTKHEETFMFSSMLSVLTIFSPCLHLGSNYVINLLCGVYPSGDLIGLLLLKNMKFTLFGSWLGAFVIPLDWDRPWQEWPVPCAYGAMVGFVIGNMFTLIGVFPKFAKKCNNKSRKTK